MNSVNSKRIHTAKIVLPHVLIQTRFFLCMILGVGNYTLKSSSCNIKGGRCDFLRVPDSSEKPEAGEKTTVLWPAFECNYVLLFA